MQPLSPPIIIIGSPRSGSTWIGHTLSAASNVHLVIEPFNPNRSLGLRLYRKIQWYEYITKENENLYTPFLDGFVRYTRPGLRDLLRTDRDRVMLSRYYLKNLAVRRRNCPQLLIKDPCMTFIAKWFVDRYGARVVMLIRHPAAFVQSMMERGWVLDFKNILEQPLLLRDHLSPYEAKMRSFPEVDSNSIAQQCLHWNMINATLAQYQRDHQDWICIHHEDFCTSPLESFSQLYQQLDLPVTNAVRRTIESNSTANRLDGRWSTDYVRDSKRIVKKWKGRLSEEDIHLIRELTEPVASTFYTDEDW